MAVTTVAYTYYARKQWREMHDAGDQTNQLLCLYQQQLAQLTKQARDTETLATQTKTLADQAVIQAKAARDSADTAKGYLGLLKKTVNSSRNQAEWQYDLIARAWVDVVPAGYKYGKDESGIPRVKAAIKIGNGAPSPAFKPHVWICSQVQETEPTVDSAPKGSQNCVERDLGIIGTGSFVEMDRRDQTTVVPPNSLPDSTEIGSRHFYIWGVVKYFTLGNNKQHFRSFCFLSGAGEQFGPCAQGNEAN